MSERERIVKIAAGEIGYKEGKNNDSKYGRWYGMNYNPWCAMFVSWCAAQANITTGVILKFAYVPYGVDFFKKQGGWKGRGYIPKPGDIVFFGDEAHVGIVEKVKGNTLYTIEGNTSGSGNNANGDGVYRKSRSLSNSWIMGYGVPKYKEDGTEDKKGGDTVEISLRVLKNGGSGENVKALQILLNGLGYNCGTADGDFGAKTLAAVKKYQTAKKLSVDGIVGKNTWAALMK